MKDDLHNKKGKQAAAFGDIPEGYFDQLQNRIDCRIQSETEPRRRPQKRYLGVAALFLLMFTLGFVGVYFLNNKHVTPIQTASYPTEDSLNIFSFEFSALEYFTSAHQPNLHTDNTDALINDTTLNNMLNGLESEEIILYLLEKNEFEF